MAHDPKEVAKQLVGYADSITAFAVAQSIAFTFAVGNGDKFAQHVKAHFWIPIAIALCVFPLYAWFAHLCHRDEDNILETHRETQPTMQKALGHMRSGRYLFIASAGLLVIFMSLSTRWPPLMENHLK